MRTIYIRSNPYRVVVKPHPGDAGINLLPAQNLAAAQAHAQKLHDQYGWPIENET